MGGMDAKGRQEMANYFPLKTLWRSYFCALVATSVLAVR
jgi:chloride channel 3/4/5